jgi:cellulose biosynthesis protein BcsQ
LAIIFVVGNFKGGSGKTKICTMISFDKAIVQKKKTLMIDLDPQANATQILMRSANLEEIDKTMGNWLEDVKAARKDLGRDTGLNEVVPLSNYVTPLLPNLDIIAGSVGFRSFNGFINRVFEEDDFLGMSSFLKPFIDEISKDYEYIYIDVPPTISETTDNAFMSADYSIIAFQTTEESLDAVGRYISYQEALATNLGAQIEVIGILTTMLKSTSTYDQSKAEEANELYGNLVFDEYVPFSERLKNYSTEGIHLDTYKNGNFEQWDYRAHLPFINALVQIDNRIEFLESEGNE